MRIFTTASLAMVALLGLALLIWSVRYILALRLGAGYAETGLVGMVGAAIALPIIAVPLWFLARRKRAQD